MPMIFQLPQTTAFDSDGIVIPGAKLAFYDAGTTDAQTVYSDSALSTAISQPVTADSAGRFQPIYLAAGTYKVVLKDADGNTIYTADNLDSGLPAGSGALPIASGGTGATTASAARTALGAASASDLSTLSSSMGGLATLDTVSRSELATGFGAVTLQGPTVVASTTSLVTCSTALPADDTIPQNSEGTEVLSGNFTPISASSKLVIWARVRGGASAAAYAGAALFTGASVSAIASSSAYVNSANYIAVLDFLHVMDSPGTNAITFSVRAGPASGTLYVNGIGGGTRLHGGVQKAALVISEILSI